MNEILDINNVHGYLDKKDGPAYLNAGDVARGKEGSYTNGNGVNIITKTPKVAGKGQVYFINKFLKG